MSAPLNIGIVCYASVGGSGVVATELAHALALRGHQVQLMSSEVPFRWRAGLPGLSFQRVETPPYPLFREPQYLLALTNTIANIKTNIRNASTDDEILNDGTRRIDLTVDVNDLQHLERVVSALKGVEGVIEVERLNVAAFVA